MKDVVHAIDSLSQIVSATNIAEEEFNALVVEGYIADETGVEIVKNSDLVAQFKEPIY